jgi:hypothetical protein
MANLRANKITSTEVFETTGSVQFDGDNDNLSIADSDDFTFGSGDFTLEAWIYPQQYGNFPSIINKYTTNVSSSQWFWSLGGSGSSGQDFYFYSGSTNYNVRNLGNVPLHQWTHCAVSKQGGSIKVFQNGILQGNLEVGSVSMNDTSVAVTIGTDGDNLYDFKGHISNARILKGTALYTKNFTPPTRELTAIPNTVLLACQSKTQTNQEATGKTITVNGNAVANEFTPGLLTTTVKSGGSSAITGSVEFDGTGDYLSIPDNEGFNMGTGDFTLECWVNSTNNSDYQGFFGSYDYDNAMVLFQISNTGVLRFVNPSTIDITGTTNLRDGGWHHIVMCRSGSTLRGFVDGIQEISTTYSSSIDWGHNNNSIVIGIVDRTDYPGQYEYKGFISNLRVIKGTALYTQNFIPPTRKLIRLPGTVLLCCQDNTSSTTEATGKTITANGNPTARKFVPQVGSDGGLVFDGVTKVNTQNYFYLPTGTTEQQFPNFAGVDATSARGIFAGGFATPANYNTIDYITIASTGNAFDFGDLTQTRGYLSACASSTRGVLGGGYVGSTVNTIDYVTIASTGDATDFGDLFTGRYGSGACSSSTRGIFGAGYFTPATVNSINYITIASTGNANDFGDLTESRGYVGSCSSNTRGLFGGGNPIVNTIDFITISTTGNAQDFGDLTNAKSALSACSSSTRGIWGGGNTPTQLNTIDYVTIASTGNAQDFGDLTTTKSFNSACSSNTRGVFGGGQNPSGFTNEIEYITILTQGNAQDFGDLTVVRQATGACSNGHGGLG